MEVVISKSKKPDKKYDATINGKKTVSFGSKGASRYTKTKRGSNATLIDINRVRIGQSLV